MKKKIYKIKIKLIAGKGGNGIISFFRNKYINKGGPDGGNGGKGGNIYLETNHNINSLNHLKNKKIIKSENGENGKKNNCTGKNGKNLYIKIPINTKINIIKKNKTYLIKNNNIKLLIAKGGKPGIGNNQFKSSINRTPLKYTKGKKGEKLNIKLEIIFYYDIGIIGLPNCGKSSLFKKLTLIKKTKIKNYPFTTLNPQIGIIKKKTNNNKLSIVDTPPIIKGSYKKNNDLSIKFLKYVKNCKLLLHILEINENIKIILKNINIIKKEILNYNNNIYKIKKFLIFNKKDLINKKSINKIKNFFIKNKNKNKIFFISTKNKYCINLLKKEIFKYLNNTNK